MVESDIAPIRASPFCDGVYAGMRFYLPCVWRMLQMWYSRTLGIVVAKHRSGEGQMNDEGAGTLGVNVSSVCKTDLIRTGSVFCPFLLGMAAILSFAWQWRLTKLGKSTTKGNLYQRRRLKM